MKLQTVLVGSASALALLAVGIPAVAQDTQTMETVTVTGYRASLDRALDIKRDSVTLVDAVSAEDIGKFPDKNVADALQRVPGINTVSAGGGEGGFDENDRVSIRGTNPSLTDVQVDGHKISTGDWFILDQFGTVGRSVSFTLLPSEIVSNLKVYKSQQADLVEGGVAGMVDIITRKPLDLKDPLTIEASAEAAYTTLRGKTTPQFNALFGWRDPSDKFGVIVQAFYEQRDIRRDGQEFLGYSQVGAGSNAGIAHPDLVGAYYPNLIGSALFMQQRTREGGDVAVQFAPSDSFEFDVEGFYSKLKASNINNNFMFWGSNEFGGNVPSAYTIKNNTIVAATFPSAGGTPIVADSIARPGSDSSSYYVNAHGRWDANENLSVQVQGGFTRGTGNTDPQLAWEGEVQGATGGTAGYSITSTGVATVSVPGVDLSNPHNLINDWAWTVVDTSVDREYYGQIDATQKVHLGPIDSIKVGARFADHRHTVTVWDGGVSYGDNATDISNSNYPSDFASSFRVPGFLYNVPLGNTAMMEAFMFNPANTSWRPYPQTPGAISDPAHHRYYWPGSMDLVERDSAAYVMANFGGEGWKGNFGVRVVETAETINQNANATTDWGTGTCPSGGTYEDFGCFVVNKISHHYWDVLPSANISIDVNDNSVLRFAAAETMARPDYSALGGAVSLTDLILTGSGGNPNLRPIRSANYNVSYEWYYAPQSLLAVSAFYMDLSSYVGFGTHQAVYLNMLLTGTGSPVYSTYNITSPINTSGHSEGFEAQWEQPIYGGFGVQTNFTYADGVDNNGGPLVGDAKITTNLTAYYENDWLSARVSYGYRSKMLIGLDRSSPEYQSPADRIDASIQYTVNDNISLTFDALNITNRLLRYTQGTSEPRAIYDNGRQLYAGIRVKY
ncbi:MAG: TonB-dependent receptor [Alphaproteobacteria bacterium]|nr:TonB-dependent receptor [Alphaproteobacteria bacterium]